MTRKTQTAAERIAATLARSDFLATRRGLVSTDDLRSFLPAYPAGPVTLPEPMAERKEQ